jgi:hypothetical protein
MMAAALLICAGAASAQVETTGEVVVAQVVWPGQDLSHATFRVFADQQMKDLVDMFPSGGAGGAGLLALRPGTYYVMVVVDANANGKADAGDGFGFYGVEDLAPSSRPQPLVVGDEVADAVAIHVLMTMGEDGRLAPLPGAPRGTGTVTGRIVGATGAAFVMLRSEGEARSWPAALAVGDGAFEIEVEAGECALYVHASRPDAAGQAQPADWYVVRTLDDEPVEIAADSVTDLGDLDISGGSEAPEGLPALVVGVVTGPATPDDSRIFVQFCADERMRSVVGQVQAGSGGVFVAAIEPAVYYLHANVGPDATPGPGDMLGFFGVSDLMGGQRPEALSLRGDQVRADVHLALTARVNDEGRLVAIPAADTAANDGTGE